MKVIWTEHDYGFMWVGKLGLKELTVRARDRDIMKLKKAAAEALLKIWYKKALKLLL